jgi:pilus assembly protein Flp/PilA
MTTENNAVLTEERGATLVEYALLVGLITVLCIAAITTIGKKTQEKFSQVSSALTTP